MNHEVLLVYDGECPVCRNYCRFVRLRNSVGELRLVDAREPGETMELINARGLDIDEGMVLITGETLYYGSDAIHALALMSSRSGFFNRFNYWLLSNRRMAHLLYPFFRSCRNLLLKTMRKSRINTLGIEGNERF